MYTGSIKRLVDKPESATRYTKISPLPESFQYICPPADHQISTLEMGWWGALSQQSSFTTVDVAARAWCRPGLVSNELRDDRDTYRA